MTFSLLEWIYPQLPDIDVAWQADWPDSFESLPIAVFRLAEDSTGVVTTEGEGSARIGIFTDIWAKTPEDREALEKQINEGMLGLGFIRGMRRPTVEIAPDGMKRHRYTTLWSGEIDHNSGRLCVQR